MWQIQDTKYPALTNSTEKSIPLSLMVYNQVATIQEYEAYSSQNQFKSIMPIPLITVFDAKTCFLFPMKLPLEIIQGHYDYSSHN